MAVTVQYNDSLLRISSSAESMTMAPQLSEPIRRAHREDSDVVDLLDGFLDLRLVGVRVDFEAERAAAFFVAAARLMRAFLGDQGPNDRVVDIHR